MREVLDPLSTRELPGVGKVQQKILREVFGIHTVKDLRDVATRGELSDVFPRKTATFLLTACHGVSSSAFLSWSSATSSVMEEGRSLLEGKAKDSTRKSAKRERKGMSRERTFRATGKLSSLISVLRRLCSKLGEDLMSTNTAVPDWPQPRL